MYKGSSFLLAVKHQTRERHKCKLPSLPIVHCSLSDPQTCFICSGVGIQLVYLLCHPRWQHMHSSGQPSAAVMLWLQQWQQGMQTGQQSMQSSMGESPAMYQVLQRYAGTRFDRCDPILQVLRVML